MDAGDRARAPLRPRRRRRRLCGVLRHRRPEGSAITPALRHSHRVLRGKRQLRSSCLFGRAPGKDRYTIAGGRTRFRLRQLRAAVGHDLVARPGERRAKRRGAERRRAFRRCKRRRRLELPHRALASRAHRGRADRSDQGSRLPRRDPRGAAHPGRTRRERPRRRGMAQISLRRGNARDACRWARTGAQPHLAADARRDWRRRPARARERGQCAASEDRACAFAAAAAERRCAGGGAAVEGNSRE